MKNKIKSTVNDLDTIRLSAVVYYFQGKEVQHSKIGQYIKQHASSICRKC